MKVCVHGASDDLVEWAGQGDVVFLDEPKGALWAEYNVCDISRYRVQAGDDAALVYALYSEVGCWVLGVGQVDEGTPIPAYWKISIDQSPETGYSARVTIEADASLTVQRVQDGD